MERIVTLHAEGRVQGDDNVDCDRSAPSLPGDRCNIPNDARPGTNVPLLNSPTPGTTDNKNGVTVETVHQREVGNDQHDEVMMWNIVFL